MKTILMVAAWCVVLFGNPAIAQTDGLLAWYPLNGTANDTTGQMAAMTLTNTPFAADGGIFCNGVPMNMELENWSNAETPILPESIFKEFGMSVYFKVDELPNGTMPVMVGGGGWRWMSINLAGDGTVELHYNNGQRIPSEARITPGSWHVAGMTWDSTSSTGQLYLDGVLACSGSFVLEHGPEWDWTVGITNQGNATNFKGAIRDIKLYATSRIP